MAEPLDRGMPSGSPNDREPIPGAHLLEGRSPSEILNRLVDGDPLGLRQRTSAMLRAEGLLLDPERLWLRSAARTAYAAAGRRGLRATEAWLAARMAQAVDDLRGEQEAEELRGTPWRASPDADYYAAVGRAIDAEPEFARLACVVINALPRDARLVFQAIALEKQGVEECTARGFGDADRVVSLLEEAVRAVAYAWQSRSRGPRAPEQDHGN